MSADEKRIRVQISEADFMCKNGCGYYGTPQWKGFCSKCWRSYQMQEKRNLDYTRNRSLLSFEKFEEKHRISAGSRGTSTISSIWGKGPSIESAGVHGTTTAVVRHNKQRKLSGDSQVAKEKFLEFLQQLPKVIAHEVSKQTQHAIDKIFANQHIAVDELSELVQNFYHVLYERMNNSNQMNDINAKFTPEEIMHEVEHYICVQTYKVLFCAKTDEEVADLSLQDHIRSLHWVTAGFLETNLDFANKQVVDNMDQAMSELIQINSKRGTAEKLLSLVSCSKRIFQALKATRLGAPASADEFLPVLIYVILKGNPPLIQSNLKFISRFALPSRVMSGESGYYFTNLSCALQFVQSMNADSLHISKEEFEAYTSGNLAPPLNETNCGCHHSIKSMENSVVRLKLLNEKHKEMAEKLDSFQKKMTSELDAFQTEVRLCSENYLTREDSISNLPTPERNLHTHV